MRFPVKKYIYCIILALLGIMFIFLAQWQVSRAHYKQNLYKQRLAKINLPPQQITNQPLDPLADRFLPVTLTGHYLSKFNFLLDNQQQNKQAGFLLLTPFKISQSHQIVLINRSWLPRMQTRQEFPPITTPTNEVKLTGYINHPVTGILLGANLEQDTWPLIIQKIDFELISAKVGERVANYIVQLSPINYIDIGSNKHWGYAVQWAALATMVLSYMIYLMVKWN